jgi:hypothetical protein
MTFILKQRKNQVYNNTLSIDGWTLFGPLDEYEAITGAGFLPYNTFAWDNLILVPDLQNKNAWLCTISGACPSFVTCNFVIFHNFKS